MMRCMNLSGKFLVESLSAERLHQCLDENPSFKGYLQGYIAEEKLRDLLTATPGVTCVKKIPDRHDRKGDFSFVHNEMEYIVESKSMSYLGLRDEPVTGGTTGRVSLKRTDSKVLPDGTKTTCLERNQFDILAISTVTIDGEWNFKFILNKYLPSAGIGIRFLSSSLTINTEDTPLLRDSILDVLADIS